MIDRVRLLKAQTELESKGFNLFATLPSDKLPSDLITQLELTPFSSRESLSLILIGNGGPALWTTIPNTYRNRPDPIDNYSIECATAIADQMLEKHRYSILYPGETFPPLQSLGELAGWHNPSPLGIGINKRWGLWFAYRCLILTDAALPEIRSDFGDHPCTTCTQRHCISACPAHALNDRFALELKRCVTYRLKTGSHCSANCVARLSCPVRVEERYSMPQIAYHYSQSLETLRHYNKQNI